MEQERPSTGPRGSSSLVGVMEEAVVPREVSSDWELKGPLSNSGEDSISPGWTTTTARVSVEPSEALWGQEESQPRRLASPYTGKAQRVTAVPGELKAQRPLGSFAHYGSQCRISAPTNRSEMALTLLPAHTLLGHGAILSTPLGVRREERDMAGPCPGSALQLWIQESWATVPALLRSMKGPWGNVPALGVQAAAAVVQNGGGAGHRSATLLVFLLFLFLLIFLLLQALQLLLAA